MPRKDGKPTAAERRNTQRVEGNRQYVADATDAELERLIADPTLDDESRQMVRDEVARRIR